MFVANQRCCLCTVAADWCRGNVQAHHLLKPYEGKRGMGMKASDNNVVPLCYGHHAELHDIEGHEDNFWTRYNLEEDFGRKNAEYWCCLLYTSPSPRDGLLSRMPSSA